MGSYHYPTALQAKSTASSEREIARQLSTDACEFRARAARYRDLADGLNDPRVTAEVHACARELETKAAEIEKLVAFESQTMLDARAKAIQLTNEASFSPGSPIPRERTTGMRWIINSWSEF